MNDFLIRPARADDLEQIISVWRACFGDDDALIRPLLLDAGLINRAVAAEIDGAVRSCMFRFDGLEYRGEKCAYIYALCTEPEYRGRGLGAAAASACAQAALDAGAKCVFLRPDGAGLEDWYSGVFDMKRIVRAKYAPVRPSGGCAASASAINADEYALARAASPWLLSAPLLAAQEIVLRSSGGQLLSFEKNGLKAAACCEPSDEKTLVRELICPGELRNYVFTAIASYFGTPELCVPTLCGKEKQDFCIMCFGEDIFPENADDTAIFPFTLE